MAREKTELAERKLASIGKLEEENANLNTGVDKAKKEVAQLKEEKVALTDKVDELTRKRDVLEVYLRGLAKKLYVMLEGTFVHPSESGKLLYNSIVDSFFTLMQSSVRTLSGRMSGSNQAWTP